MNTKIVLGTGNSWLLAGSSDDKNPFLVLETWMWYWSVIGYKKGKKVVWGQSCLWKWFGQNYRKVDCKIW